MPHVWYFHALDESIDVKEFLERLQEVFSGQLTVESRDAHCSNSARRTTLTQDRGDSPDQFILVSDKELEIPTILAFSGDRDALAGFLEWLKSDIGVVMYRMILDQKSMFAVADAMCGKSQPRFYDSKFLFEVTTENKSLTTIGIEVDRRSLRSLSANRDRPYQESVVPYLYQETGMFLEKLSLTSIALTGHAKITKDGVTTLGNDIDDAILMELLRSIQPPVD